MTLYQSSNLSNNSIARSVIAIPTSSTPKGEKPDVLDYLDASYSLTLTSSVFHFFFDITI